MTAGMVAAMRERTKTTFALAVLLICVGLTLVFAREAIAYTFSCATNGCGSGFPLDSDRDVPEASGRLNPDADPSTRDYHMYGRTSSITRYYTGGLSSQIVNSIKYDWRETNYCNRPHDGLYAHERAHSRGWGHGEKDFSVNKAYYSSYPCRP